MLAIKVRGVNDGFVWAFANFYGPNVEVERSAFLDLLSDFLVLLVGTLGIWW